MKAPPRRLTSALAIPCTLVLLASACGDHFRPKAFAEVQHMPEAQRWAYREAEATAAVGSQSDWGARVQRATLLFESMRRDTTLVYVESTTRSGREGHCAYSAPSTRLVVERCTEPEAKDWVREHEAAELAIVREAYLY